MQASEVTVHRGFPPRSSSVEIRGLVRISSSWKVLRIRPSPFLLFSFSPSSSSFLLLLLPRLFLLFFSMRKKSRLKTWTYCYKHASICFALYAYSRFDRLAQWFLSKISRKKILSGERDSKRRKLHIRLFA